MEDPISFIETIAYAPPRLVAPVSQACTQAQFAEPAYAYWCDQIREPVRLHRKQWEFCYIAQALARAGMLAPGRRGLGFGVGTEPLTALFASRGAEIVATDLAPDEAARIGWIETNQHADTAAVLNDRGICPPDLFARNVTFRFADMNAIPYDLGTFDFIWSACACEHLGSIELGRQFIANTLKLLKSGGVAVHTTEFNCVSDNDTLDNDGTVLFRKRDLEQIAYDAERSGLSCHLNFGIGDLAIDKFVDIPPYQDHNHLKLKIDKWVSTSFGIAISCKRQLLS